MFETFWALRVEPITLIYKFISSCEILTAMEKVFLELLAMFSNGYVMETYPFALDYH